MGWPGGADHLMESDSCVNVSSCGVRGSSSRPPRISYSPYTASSTTPPAADGWLLLSSPSSELSQPLIWPWLESTSASKKGAGAREGALVSLPTLAIAGLTAIPPIPRSSLLQEGVSIFSADVSSAVHTVSSSSEKADAPPALLKAHTRNPYSQPSVSSLIVHRLSGPVYTFAKRRAAEPYTTNFAAAAHCHARSSEVPVDLVHTTLCGCSGRVMARSLPLSSVGEESEAMLIIYSVLEFSPVIVCWKVDALTIC
eukprot:scaffold85360_cov23-Tisochrysis_lutea.AAC.4